MDAAQQVRQWNRVEKSLREARFVAAQMTGSLPVIEHIRSALAIAERFRTNLEQTLQPSAEAVCFGVDEVR